MNWVGNGKKEFERLRAKTYSYLKENKDEDEKAKVKKIVLSNEISNLKIIKTV